MVLDHLIFVLIILLSPGGTVKEKEKKEEEMKNAYYIKDDDALECSVCLELFQDPRATACNHLFCKDCIEGVIGTYDENDGPCPVCRQSVALKKLRPAIMPKKAADEEAPAEKVTKVQKFIYTTKLAVLVEHLKTIRDKDPSSKSLVFSQFQSTLKWLQNELPKHGFKYRTLSGDMPMAARTKALREFQSDPPTTIFLLSLRAGAVGINLTQANRVFIMEPA